MATGGNGQKIQKPALPFDIFPILRLERVCNPKRMKTPIGLFIFLFLVSACGGSLTDEQRKEMREKMEMNKIVRVTEVEIMEAAFEKGRNTIETLEKLKGDSAKMDSFLRINGGRIRFMKPGQRSARALEQQLMDAYLADESGSRQDNVQKRRNEVGDFDSLLYTKPVTNKLPDGSAELMGVWNIWLSKKDLVLEAGKLK